MQLSKETRSIAPTTDPAEHSYTHASQNEDNTIIVTPIKNSIPCIKRDVFDTLPSLYQAIARVMIKNQRCTVQEI